MPLFIGVYTPGPDERGREDREEQDMRLVEATDYNEAKERLTESYIDDYGEDEEAEGEPEGTLAVYLASGNPEDVRPLMLLVGPSDI